VDPEEDMFLSCLVLACAVVWFYGLPGGLIYGATWKVHGLCSRMFRKECSEVSCHWFTDVHAASISSYA